MRDNFILWDFDGVLLDSNKIRDLGFSEVLNDFPGDQVDQLLAFHHQNGGLSRYVKFRYFFETIRGEFISDTEIQSLAAKFSVIMRKKLLAPELLIRQNIEYIRANAEQIAMHIVSGSDQIELRYLCKQHHIDHLFRSIEGSPTPKIELVRGIMTTFNYPKEKCYLVGDSFNDYEAAHRNSIRFIAFNNPSLEEYSFLPYSTWIKTVASDE